MDGFSSMGGTASAGESRIRIAAQSVGSFLPPHFQFTEKC